MTTSSTRSSRAFTLLEILLAIGLAVILALVAVPSMDGWWSEHRMRMQAGEFIEVVQRAKIVAEKEGKRQVVVLSSKKERTAGNSTGGVHQFVRDSQYTWKIIRFDGSEDVRSQPTIGIDSRGWVEPISFRLQAGERYVEYRFDFLTGHAKEEGYSL